MQPMTPMTRSGRCALSNRSSPSFEKTFSSAFSRIAQVLTRIRSASASSAVSSQLRSRSSPATRSESYSFIWQPYVIRWSLAMRSSEKFRLYADLTVASALGQVKQTPQTPPARPRVGSSSEGLPLCHCPSSDGVLLGGLGGRSLVLSRRAVYNAPVPLAGALSP